jgi:hypothetical protein
VPFKVDNYGRRYLGEFGDSYVPTDYILNLSFEFVAGISTTTAGIGVVIQRWQLLIDGKGHSSFNTPYLILSAWCNTQRLHPLRSSQYFLVYAVRSFDE